MKSQKSNSNKTMVIIVEGLFKFFFSVIIKANNFRTSQELHLLNVLKVTNYL